MRKGGILGIAALYFATAWCWAMAFLGQYPPTRLPSGFWPLLHWSTLTLGLFGLTACGALYVRARGIRRRTMRAAVVLSAASAFIGLVGYWYRSQDAWLTTVYVLETLLATSAVAFVWAGLLSLPRFKGWRRGTTLVASASVQVLAAVTVVALLVDFTGNLDLPQAILLGLCALGAGALSIADTLCLLVLATVQGKMQTEEDGIHGISVRIPDRSPLLQKVLLASVIAAVIGLATGVPQIPDPTSDLYKTLKALIVAVCLVLGLAAAVFLAVSTARKGGPQDEKPGEVRNARATRRNTVLALVPVLLLCAVVLGWTLTNHYQERQEERQLAAEAQAAAEPYFRGNPEPIYSHLGVFQSLTGEGYGYPVWNITGALVELRRTGVFSKGTIPVGIFVYLPAGGIHVQTFSRNRIYLDYGGIDHPEPTIAVPPLGQAIERQTAWEVPLGIREGRFAGIEMVWIEPGSFMMGSPGSEAGRGIDETQHLVTLTKGFWMGKYEVTQAQWTSVMSRNPSDFKTAPDFPVENVFWSDCQLFIAKLNAKGEATFRLPTEAEWEYACRAGSGTAYCFGDTTYDMDDYAWYSNNSGGWTTHSVGQKRPNVWGLYDMHGNVQEWCQDCLHDRYYY